MQILANVTAPKKIRKKLEKPPSPPPQKKPKKTPQETKKPPQNPKICEIFLSPSGGQNLGGGVKKLIRGGPCFGQPGGGGSVVASYSTKITMIDIHTGVKPHLETPVHYSQ